jgi:hypothetical protein
MTGLSERPSREPRENRKVSRTGTYAAERAAILASARAGTAQARGADLALLAAEFARKIAAARRHYSGDELAAALAALHSERRAAETALLAKLAVEARNRRRAMLAALRGTGQGRGGDFRQTLHARSTRPTAAPTRARATRPASPMNRNPKKGGRRGCGHPEITHQRASYEVFFSSRCRFLIRYRAFAPPRHFRFRSIFHHSPRQSRHDRADPPGTCSGASHSSM